MIWASSLPDGVGRAQRPGAPGGVRPGGKSGPGARRPQGSAPAEVPGAPVGLATGWRSVHGRPTGVDLGLTASARRSDPWPTSSPSSVSPSSWPPCSAWSGRWSGYDAGPRSPPRHLHRRVHLPRHRHVQAGVVL